MHYSGLYTTNVKAAIVASQAPDPKRTMLFLEELYVEVKIQRIVKFVFEHFTTVAPNLELRKYEELRRSIEDMLKSIDLFIRHPQLGEHLEAYNCDNPISFDELKQKADDFSEVEPNKKLILEINQYKNYLNQYTKIRQIGKDTEQNLNILVSKWKETLRCSKFCGYNDINKFYERYDEFRGIRDAKCRVCTICGGRTRRDGVKFQDCIEFLYLLQVTDAEVEDYEALVKDETDEIGRLAQHVFHIKKVGEKYYHFLDLDEEKYYRECKDTNKMSEFSLCKNGNVLKLPGCPTCESGLSRRSKWAKEHPNIMLDAEFGPPLPDFAFKLRDFGRIPEGLPELNAIDRTAISPFAFFSRILQLRNSSRVEGGAQSATSGTSLSRKSLELSGKEFFLPFTDKQFSKSFRTCLPRDDMASLGGGE